MVPAVPADAGAHRPRQPGAARADHRHPRRAGLRPRARRGRALRRRPTTTLTDDVAAGRSAAWRSCSRPCMLVLNVSSVAALWFGADRIDSGADADRRADRLPQLPHPDPHGRDDGHVRGGPGAPRRRCAPSASRRCSTPPSSVVAPPSAGHRAAAPRHRSSCATSASTTPAPRHPVLQRHLASGSRRADDRHHRQHRLGQDDAAQPRSRGCSTPPAGTVLVDGVDVRDLEPETLWSRIGLVPQKPYLFSGTVASNLRYANPDATDDELWAALEIAQATDFVRGHARRARRADRPGRLQRVGRPAPAARHRPGPRAPARDLPVRRLVLGARPRHRRPAARRAGARTPPTPPSSSSPSGCRRSSTPTRSSCSRTASIVGLGTHDELLETCPTYAEIVASQLTAEEAA